MSIHIKRIIHIIIITILFWGIISTSTSASPSETNKNADLLTQDTWNVDFLGQLGGETLSVSINDNYAYIGVGPNLIILNISNPGSPVIVGKTNPLPGIIWNITVDGDHVYVGMGNDGFSVIDVSDPTTPTVIGFYDTSGSVGGIGISGSNAYVADGANLQVIDISDPSNPTPINSLAITGSATDLALRENYLYVACDSGGLRVIDIADPANLIESGYYDNPDRAWDVTIEGDYAYVADASAGLRVINISDPSLPIEVGYYDTPGVARDVTVLDNYAYIGDWYSGLRVINVSDPSNPFETGFYQSNRGFGAWEVAISGHIVIVAYDNGGMVTVDVANPTNPIELGGYETIGYVYSAAVLDNYAYVTETFNGFSVLNVDNPSNPVKIGHYSPAAFGYSEAVSWGYAYIAFEGLRVLNTADSTNPYEVGFYDTPGTTSGVVISGKYAYVADGSSGVRIVDVSDPTNPNEISFCDTPGFAHDIAVSGNFIYIADGDSGIRVVNAADPYLPVEAGFYDTSGDTLDVYIYENHAFVADGSNGLRLLDISNPANPIEIGSYNSPGVANSVVVSGNYAYIADDEFGLRVIDISQPSNLIEVGYYDTAGHSRDISVIGELIYVADYDGGLYILRFIGDELGFLISGRVTNINTSNPLPYVNITNGSGLTVFTDVNGYYAFNGLKAKSYLLTPYLDEYSFSPAYQNIIIPPIATGVDFSGTSIDLSIISAVAVQSVEGVELVRDKNTSIKVVISKIGAESINNISVKLQVGGTEYTRFYVGDQANGENHYKLIQDNSAIPLSFPAGPSTKTIYFFEPNNYLSPTGDLVNAVVYIDPSNSIPEIDENNNEYNISTPIKDTRWGLLFPNLDIKYFNAEGMGLSEIVLRDYMNYSNDFVRASYPIAEERYLSNLVNYDGKIGTCHWFELKCDSLSISFWAINTLKLLRISYPTVDTFAGIVPQGWFGLNFIPNTALGFNAPLARDLIVTEAYWEPNIPDGFSLLAHELGHSYGISEEAGSASPGLYLNSGNNIPIIPSTERRIRKFMDPFVDVTEEEWIDLLDYQKLFNDHSSILLNQKKNQYLTQNILLASGIVDITGTVTLDDWYVLQDMELSQLESGPYSIEYYDESNTNIYSQSFNVDFSFYFGVDITNTQVTHAPFVFSLPYFPNISRIMITNNGSIVSEKIVSAHSPIVSITSPRAESIIHHQATIRWEGYDEDGDAISYALLFSSDNGLTWNPIGIDITDEYYSWDTSQLQPGTEYKIKILATDGFNTGIDETAYSFTIVGDLFLPLVSK
jgi:hypothetical protein